MNPENQTVGSLLLFHASSLAPGWNAVPGIVLSEVGKACGTVPMSGVCKGVK